MDSDNVLICIAMAFFSGMFFGFLWGRDSGHADYAPKPPAQVEAKP